MDSVKFSHFTKLREFWVIQEKVKYIILTVTVITLEKLQRLLYLFRFWTVTKERFQMPVNSNLCSCVLEENYPRKTQESPENTGSLLILLGEKARYFRQKGKGVSSKLGAMVFIIGKLKETKSTKCTVRHSGIDNTSLSEHWFHSAVRIDSRRE